MKSFREALGFANEIGLALSGLLLIGYCGVRGWLGWLPALLAIAVVIAATAIAWMITKPLDQPTEESFYSEEPKNSSLNKFIIFLGMMIWGAIAFVYIGSLL